jgi:hypothetical protein
VPEAIVRIAAQAVAIVAVGLDDPVLLSLEGLGQSMGASPSSITGPHTLPEPQDQAGKGSVSRLV